MLSADTPPEDEYPMTFARLSAKSRHWTSRHAASWSWFLTEAMDVLSKKKSRPIVFNGHPYRWSVAEDGVYVILAVQRSNIDGQKLEVIIRAIELQENSDASEFRPITPALVSNIMAGAMSRGWQPTHRHPPLELSLDENDKLEVRRGLANNL